MIAVLTVLLTVFLFIISHALYAKPYSSLLCKDPQFICYVVKRGDTWGKLFRDPNQQDLVMRINRINIRLHPGMKIAIPKNINNVTLMDYAPFPKQIPAQNKKAIIVSLKYLAWGAYDENGTLQHWGPVSGGQGYCSDIGRGCHTPNGTFAVYRKEGRGCVSTKFPVGRGGAPMPYCMFFHGGFALHGSYEVPGYNASHGCVRIFVNDGKWLNEEFISDEKSVPVVINSQT